MIIMPSVTPHSLFIEQDHFNRIVEHLISVWPEEGCGLLAGNAGVVERVFAIPNILHSQTRFRMDPAKQVSCMHTIQDEGMQLLAIFHSHPEGPSQPSATDLSESAYPQAASLIFWLEDEEWRARAFSLVDGQAVELKLVVN